MVKTQIFLSLLEDSLKVKQRKGFRTQPMWKKMMDQTFSLRRKEIVEEQPPVKRMMERWPALFTESQVWPTDTALY